MKKVTFPSRDDVVATTIVVIIASLVFAFFSTWSDVVINKVYGFVFGIFGMMTDSTRPRRTGTSSTPTPVSRSG